MSIEKLAGQENLSSLFATQAMARVYDVDKMAGKAKGQKNFGLKAALEPFEKWCAENGYDHRTAFLAGWLLLMSEPHAVRRKFFAALPEWESLGFPVAQDHLPSEVRAALNRAADATIREAAARGGESPKKKAGRRRREAI